MALSDKEFLEEQISLAKEFGQMTLPGIMQECRRLREQNKALRGRMKTLEQLSKDWLQRVKNPRVSDDIARIVAGLADELSRTLTAREHGQRKDDAVEEGK